MDDMEYFLAKLDLIDECCTLKHSDEDPAENHSAVDYLCQNFGQELSTDMGHSEEGFNVSFSIRVPICQECVDALLSEEWILFYCIHCNSSQWVCRKYAKYQYPFWLHIKWADDCPMCHYSEEVQDKDND